MTEIIKFIEAQLAIDEQVARDASGHTVVGTIGNWSPSPTGDEWEASVSEHGDEELLVALRPGLLRPPEAMSGYWGAIIGTSDECRDRDEASPVPALTHAARYDPARVLAEVAAKQAILADVLPGVIDAEDAFRDENDTGEDGDRDFDWHQTSGLLLRLLAAPYADRPGFKPEWRLP